MMGETGFESMGFSLSEEELMELNQLSKQLVIEDYQKKRLQKELRDVKSQRSATEKELLQVVKRTGMKEALDEGKLTATVKVPGAQATLTQHLKTKVKHRILPRKDAPQKYWKDTSATPKVDSTAISQLLAQVERCDCLMPIYARLVSQLKKGEMPERVTKVAKLESYDAISVRKV